MLIIMTVALLTRVRWYLIVVFTWSCLFLKTGVQTLVEHRSAIFYAPSRHRAQTQGGGTGTPPSDARSSKDLRAVF